MKITIKNEKFIQFDEGVGLERIIILRSRENFSYLQNSQVLMCDGTFNIRLSSFRQLFTIFGSVKNIHFPLVYCLLGSKTEKIYQRCISIVKMLVQTTKLKHMICDFWIHYKYNVRSFWWTKIHFWYFHFRQSFYWKIIQFGFKNNYESNIKIKRFFRYVFALSFVPVKYWKEWSIYWLCWLNR